MLKKLLAFCVGVTLSATCFAVSSGPKVVRTVEVTDSFFVVYFTDAQISGSACQQSDKIVYFRPDFLAAYSSMLATALTAFSTGKHVTAWIDGCKMGPWGQTLPFAQSIAVTVD